LNRESASVEETEAIGRELATELVPDGALLLEGDLGAGKTALVRGLAAGMGIAPETVRSPTFTLMNDYGEEGQLLHVDLYRLEGDEIVALGLEERLALPGVKVIEWSERVPFPVTGARTIRIEVRPDGSRLLREIL